MSAACGECGAALLWAVTPERARMPLDAAPVVEPMVSLCAYNPVTGGCVALTQDDVDSGRAARWVDAGVTLHHTHWLTCSRAERFRVAPGQVSMFDDDQGGGNVGG